MAAYSFSQNMIQYNVCGSACDDTHAQRALDYAAWFFNANPAYSMSLNELCLEDFMNLAAALGKDGRFVVSKQSAAGCPGTDKRFGNGLIVRGLVDASSVWYLPTQKTTPCGSLNIECRTIVCIKSFTSVGGPVGQCTTHLARVPEGEPDTVTVSQAAEYAVIGNSWLSSYPHRTLSGDFNLQPARLDLKVPFYSENYHDLVFGYTLNPLATLNRQLDYIWLRMGPNAYLMNPLCPNDASDHCIAFGAGGW